MGCSAKCFDWASSFYDYSRAIPEDLMKKIIDTLQEKLRIDSSSKILEVGIGTGRIAIPLTEKLNLNIVGVDISKKMIQKCQEKVSPGARIQLIVADGLRLPFSNNQFNIIFTCHMLHLLSNAYQFVEKITSLLVKNGFYINLEAFVDYHQTLPFKIYYNKLTETGWRHIFLGDLIRRGLIIYLSRKGWSHTEYIIKSQREISINNLVLFLRERVFSHQRTIIDDLHKQSLEHLYMELEKNNIDLSKTVSAPATSRFSIFQRNY
ncbi:MAG: class I SAM-dependent methyltransferase [Promethearchaeota archaeon]